VAEQSVTTVPDAQTAAGADPAPGVSTGRLLLVGLGVGGMHRLTPEADDALSGAAEILHVSPLQPGLERRYGRDRVRSLYHLYQDEGSPAKIYRRMADISTEAATRAAAHGGYVCLAMYGHPLWLAKPSRIAMEIAATEQISVHVVPGLSTFDTLLVDSPVELDWGVQMLEATRFVRQQLAVDRRVPLLLFQAGVFGATTVETDLSGTERFRPLVNRLREIYGSGHPVYTVMSGWGDQVPTTIQVATVDDFPEMTEVHGSTTLIIPPVEAGS
jgi:hypothetical protein